MNYFNKLTQGTPIKAAGILSGILLGIGAMVTSFTPSPTGGKNLTSPDLLTSAFSTGDPARTSLSPADSTASVQAFMGVYKVLMSPRCMNCHPAGDAPLQGDDSHVHTMNVQRGVDGHGLYALKCSNCHQAQNVPGPHTPPGNPKWALPPADTKMVFQGRTPRQLAQQLLDPKRNGGKTKQQLIEHAASDGIVLGGWNPGEGRTLPPISHAEFARLFKTWIDKGAYLPKK